ncbi:MATE family efflux transporter [Marinomonas sp. GJ51-6]|uniref:MATE family efflux transporter n=1 Tax=Marinomonas sp. GJ51-6 TaxID=2992802 RepID=UPI002934FB78|nr:MATE family efflux transporter [Marinomonas sp. GJ51-6]WOD09109.1 MATE family efflux transporter [Marinomonas sp. GJ51-6]
MSSPSYLRKNISLAWPLALNGLLMQSMLMIDTLLISPLGEIPLAALGIASAILAFMLGVQMALANGTQLILSRAVGSGNNNLLTKGFWAGLSINFAVALVFCISMYFGAQSIVSSLSGDLLLQQQTKGYLELAIYLVPSTAIAQVLIALFNSRDKSKTPLKGYLIEMPINAVLSYFLIHGVNGFQGMEGFQGMGVEGAALGSLIAIIIRLLYLIVCLKIDRSLDLEFNSGLSTLVKSIRLHSVEIFPFAANITILQIGISVYQLLYSQLSINAYAAIILIMPWLRGIGQFVASWAHASAISISQAIGSKKLDDLADNINKSIDVAVIVSVICAGLFVVLHFFLPSIYPDLEAETYVALSVIAPLYIFLPIVRGYNTVHGHILRALGKTTSVFKINFIGQWIISIPLCALLILYFDASIFWAFAIQPFEEVVKALPFRMLARKSIKEFDQAKMDKLMYDEDA